MTPLAPHLTAFFQQRLPLERRASRHTSDSYAYALTIRSSLNLPFSEWTQVIPNARLCKAVLDRITDCAHIIDTGHDSYRFRRTLEKRPKKG
jgi:hypothetical protein